MKINKKYIQFWLNLMYFDIEKIIIIRKLENVI